MSDPKDTKTEIIGKGLKDIQTHPKRGPEWLAVASTDYTLWWKCLRESEDYAKALRGELGEPWAGMAADFGELEPRFEIWWILRGRQLLGNEVYQRRVVELASPDQYVKDDMGPNMLVEVPLTVARKDIIKQFTEVLDITLAKQYEPKTNPSGIRRQFYPDQRMRPGTVEQLLKVWRARRGATEDWWETGERLGYWPHYHCLPEDDEAAAKEKRRLMSVSVQRLHRMAASLIKFAAMGDFPRVK